MTAMKLASPAMIVRDDIGGEGRDEEIVERYDPKPNRRVLQPTYVIVSLRHGLVCWALTTLKACWDLVS